MDYLTLIPILLILVFFYFFLIRPQKKQERQMKEMLNSLNVGDEVSLNSGIIGRIIKIKDDILTLEVNADKTKIKVFKWAVRQVEVPIIPPEEQTPQKADTDGEASGSAAASSAEDAIEGKKKRGKDKE